jgi:DNA-binding CsgD family transcriptional regulator
MFRATRRRTLVGMGDDTFQPSGTAVATDGPRSRALDEDVPAMRATDGPNPSTAEHDADGVLKSLTPRERQVAAVVAAGLSNQRAAAALSMATKTVECHLGRIYRKLGVTSRVQLAVAIGLQASPDPEARWPSLSSSEQQIVVLIGFGNDHPPGRQSPLPQPQDHRIPSWTDLPKASDHIPPPTTRRDRHRQRPKAPRCDPRDCRVTRREARAQEAVIGADTRQRTP